MQRHAPPRAPPDSVPLAGTFDRISEKGSPSPRTGGGGSAGPAGEPSPKPPPPFGPKGPLDPSAPAPPPRKSGVRLKMVVCVFLLFLLVISDPFVNGVLGAFGESAVRCRSITPWGHLLQATCLALFYICANYLVEHDVL